MQPGLWQVEQEHARRRPTHDLTAWDCSQRGFWLLLGGTGTTAEVRTLFQRAVELDPDFALAFVGLALTHLVEFWMDWTGPNEEALAGLVRAAEKSVRLDGQLALAHCVMGYAQYLTGQPQKAVASLERAVELDPSLAIAHAWLGDALCSAGRADEAIPNVEKAMRMSPHDPMKWSFLFIIGQAHAYRGRFEEAIHCFEESFRLRPQWPPTLIWTTAIYAHLGRQDEARDALGRLVQVWPAVSLSTIRVSHAGFVDPVALERILDGLRKAGMGE